MGFDEYPVAVCANGRRRADIDALVAAGLLRPAVRAQRCLVVEELWLLELAGQRCDFHGRPGLRDGIASRCEISLGRLVQLDPRLRMQVKDKVEAFSAPRVLPVEVDRA